jgi:ParB family chromosome partitioning protein
MLAIVLGGLEEHYDFEHTRTNWRSPHDEDRFYFRALTKLGFKPSKVERLVLEPTADADKWPHLQTATRSTALDTSAQDPNGDHVAAASVANPPSMTVTGSDDPDDIGAPDDSSDLVHEPTTGAPEEDLAEAA